MNAPKETDCKIWSCYKYDPPGKTKNYLTIIAVIITILALLALVLLTVFKLILMNATETASLERFQIEPQTTVQNRNSYFSLDSSSSEDFDDENPDSRTPIIRPQRRGPINH